MSSSQFSRWFAVLLLVGCNAKLQVDPDASGGDGGGAGRGIAGTAGVPIAGAAPIDEQAGDTAGGADNRAGGDNAGGYGDAGCYPTACSGGTGGAPIDPPPPGKRGQHCILGVSSVEAEGTPAGTTVTTLDRCDNGLVCDSTKHCTGMPSCPQSTGPCLVHGVPLEGPGSAGSGGSEGPGPSDGGAGGAGSGEPTRLVAAEAGVMALAVDDTHLYWIEYGTRDGLGNYQHDGTLFSYGLVDAKTTTLAANLPGPNALGITNGHAYVAVDGGPLIGSTAHAQVLRLPLSGGASELVQDAVSPNLFASVGDQAFWESTWGIYTILPTPGATTNNLISFYSYAAELAADPNNLYYVGSAGILSLPLAGASPSLVVSPGYIFALASDSVYGIEAQGGMILDVVPKAGGAWTRKRALGAGDYADRLQIIGDRYVFSASPSYAATGIPHSTRRPLPWVTTAEAVFWSDRSAIFSRAITGK